MNEIIAADEGITLTEYGVIIIRPLTIEEWTASLRSMRRVKHAYHAILSDLLDYGCKTFGAEVATATLEQLEFDWADANKATAIARIPLATRTRYELNAEHAFVLSKLEDEAEREKWAKVCQEHSLTPLELKRSIEAGKILSAKEIADQSGQGSGVPNVQAVRFHFERWERQMGDRKKILTLQSEDRKQILNILSPIIELAAEIEQSLPA